MYQMQVYSQRPQANPFLFQEQLGETGVQSIHLDIIETRSEIIYVFELPGADINQVNVEIRDNTLYIEGSVELDLGTEEYSYLYRERISGKRFGRLAALPGEVDLEKAAAQAKNGLLLVRFPKKETGRKLNVHQQARFNLEQQTQNINHQPQPAMQTSSY